MKFTKITIAVTLVLSLCLCALAGCAGRQNIPL